MSQLFMNEDGLKMSHFTFQTAWFKPRHLFEISPELTDTEKYMHVFTFSHTEMQNQFRTAAAAGHQPATSNSLNEL